jgi:hypothetical protein
MTSDCGRREVLPLAVTETLESEKLPKTATRSISALCASTSTLQRFPTM